LPAASLGNPFAGQSIGWVIRSLGDPILSADHRMDQTVKTVPSKKTVASDSRKRPSNSTQAAKVPDLRAGQDESLRGMKSCRPRLSYGCDRAELARLGTV
jgi:hypothetical protein